MKKILYFAALVFCFAATSCEKEEIGGTATEKTAGQWYVTVDGVDADNNVLEGYEDIFGDGRFHVLTYNTAANNGSEMFVDDLGTTSLSHYFKVKVACDQNTLSFYSTAADGEENNEYSAYTPYSHVTITGGKILPGAGRQNNGSVADSIVFYVAFEGDPYPGAYGYSHYKVSGVRYSGLAEND